MALNFNNPITSNARDAVLATIREHVTALARMLDGETLSNVPVNAIRFSSSNSRFEKWNGSAWAELPMSFLKLSGGTLTGALTGTAGAFSSLTVGGQGVWQGGNFDPASKLGTGATAARTQAVVTSDPSVGQGGLFATNTDLIFRDATANRTVWHSANFNPATKQDASTAWNSGNFNPATKQDALGFTPVNKAGDSGLGGMTMSSLTSSGAVTSSEWFRTNGSQGWYNNTHGGGIYMADSTFVRTYGSKHLLADGARLYAYDGGGYGVGRLRIQNGGSPPAGSQGDICVIW